MRALRTIFAVSVCGFLLLMSQATVYAASDPYGSGASGYDYSYLQCGTPAPSASFGIVGVNAGYPFTYYNQCLSAEFKAAATTGNGAVYMNTGYSRSYTLIDGRHTTQDCANQSRTITGTKAQRAAWAVGCSEAQRDLAYAASQSAASPTAWWLDVETANSWASGDLSLNRYTIDGIVTTLRANTSAPIGVYSTDYQWQVITGGYQAAVDGEWLATGQNNLAAATPYCSSTPFTGASAKVWLVQYVTNIDNDYVC
jgi:hypothetical protein